MNLDPHQFIGGYLDETLSADEQAELNRWLKESPDHARLFAREVMLHDRLRGEHLALEEMSCAQIVVSEPSPRRGRRLAATAATLLASTMLMFVLWRVLGDSQVSAAVTEINRLIAANSSAPDRTYRIAVEEQAMISKRELPDDAPERSRPAKPPIDQAVLHVRSGGLFVLIRQTANGLPFVTGSNGQISWAVKPEGPIRRSTDLSRFSRDVPGHEHSMPLININLGLEQLRQAYDIQLLPIENSDDAAADEEPSRLLVAVKRRGFRGPQRVEISYAVRSGLIRQMRFVDMPYGPERLTLRMTLVAEETLGDRFFDHESHHETGRKVLEE